MLSTVLTLWVFLLLCASVDLTSSESHPTTYLVATNEGVAIYNTDNSSSKTTHSFPVTAVDFRFAKQDFYFISNNEILYSYYSQYSKSYSEPMRAMQFPHTLSDIVIDWVQFRIFVSSAEAGAIYEAAMSGSSHHVMADVDNVQDLATDPYQRQLFFISNGNLGSLDLRNSRQSRHSTIGPVMSVAKMAVDHHEAIIYVVGEDEHGSWVLVGSDYTGLQHTEVFRGPQLGRPTALDAFNARVVWCSGDGCFELTSSDCEQSNTCKVRQLSYKSRGEVINDIRFYSSLVQTPSTELACSQLNCSHNCSVVSLYTVTCECPAGAVVDPGGNVCREKPPFPPWADDEPFFDRLKEAVYRWALELTAQPRTLILAGCGLVLVLLLCGICVLLRPPRTKYSRRRNDSYDLAERSSYALHKRLDR